MIKVFWCCRGKLRFSWEKLLTALRVKKLQQLTLFFDQLLLRAFRKLFTLWENSHTESNCERKYFSLPENSLNFSHTRHYKNFVFCCRFVCTLYRAFWCYVRKTFVVVVVCEGLKVIKRGWCFFPKSAVIFLRSHGTVEIKWRSRSFLLSVGQYLIFLIIIIKGTKEREKNIFVNIKWINKKLSWKK